MVPFFGGLPKEEDADVDEDEEPLLFFMGEKGGFDLLGGTEKGDADEPFGIFFRGADPKGSGAEGAVEEDEFVLVGALGTGNAGNFGCVIPSFFLNEEGVVAITGNIVFCSFCSFFSCSSFCLTSSGILISSGSGCFWRVDVAEAKALAAAEPKAPSSGATPGDSASVMRGDWESYCKVTMLLLMEGLAVDGRKGRNCEENNTGVLVMENESTSSNTEDVMRLRTNNTLAAASRRCLVVHFLFFLIFLLLFLRSIIVLLPFLILGVIFKAKKEKKTAFHVVVGDFKKHSVLYTKTR